MVHAEISTDDNNYYTRLSVFESVSAVEMLQLEIEREKARRPAARDSAAVIEDKLLRLLECTLHGEKEYDGLSIPEKLKKVLANIDQFRGKQVEGISKINVLLYFFR